MSDRMAVNSWLKLEDAVAEIPEAERAGSIKNLLPTVARCLEIDEKTLNDAFVAFEAKNKTKGPRGRANLQGENWRIFGITTNKAQEPQIVIRRKSDPWYDVCIGLIKSIKIDPVTKLRTEQSNVNINGISQNEAYNRENTREDGEQPLIDQKPLHEVREISQNIKSKIEKV